MTILVSRRTGFNNDYLMIKNVTVRDAIFETEGTMRFYTYPITNVVDAEIEGSLTRLVIYTFSGGDFVLKYNSEEEAIRKIINEELAKPENAHRKTFTLDLGRMEAVTKKDFNEYSPDSEKDNLFIFDAPANEGGFPEIFYFGRPALGMTSKVFKIQAYASRVAVKCSGIPTLFGKEFMYRILNSWPLREYKDECPDLTDISFPTMRDAELPKFLNTDALKKFAETCGADKILQSLGGIVDTSDVQEQGKDAVEEAIHDLPNKIVRDILEKGTVNLTDMVIMGVSKALKLVPTKHDIIPITPETYYSVRKACIFEGKLHILPNKIGETFDYAQMWLGEDEEIIVHVSEDSYPKLSKPLLPAPKTTAGKEYIN